MSEDRDEQRVKELGLAGEPWDWREVFKYANGGEDGPFLVATEKPNTAKESWDQTEHGEKSPAFDLADVAKVEASVEGENDGAAWVAFGLLKDGRWFSISAGCDYTGWG